MVMPTFYSIPPREKRNTAASMLGLWKIHFFAPIGRIPGSVPSAHQFRKVLGEYIGRYRHNSAKPMNGVWPLACACSSPMIRVTKGRSSSSTCAGGRRGGSSTSAGGRRGIEGAPSVGAAVLAFAVSSLVCIGLLLVIMQALLQQAGDSCNNRPLIPAGR